MERFALESETITEAPCGPRKRWTLLITIKQWSSLIAHLTYGFPALNLPKELRKELRGVGGLLAAGIFRHDARELVDLYRVKNGKKRLDEYAQQVNAQTARVYAAIRCASLAEGVEPRITELVGLMGHRILVEGLTCEPLNIGDYTVRCYSGFTNARNYMN